MRTLRSRQHATPRSAQYVLNGDIPVTRVVAIALLLIVALALWRAAEIARQTEFPLARQIATFDPRSLFPDDRDRHFLPAAQAVLPPERAASPEVATAGEQVAGQPAERVRVANTGGVGAVLRAQPPRGRPVGALRDGQALTVLERQSVGDAEWLRVRTQEGAEGWVYGRLVAPAE